MNHPAAGIIPAFQPEEKLLQLVSNVLRCADIEKLIIVNDDSDSKYDSVFRKLKQFSDVIILVHEQNQGTGAAIKTGMKYILEHFPDIEGVVTFDADSQHLPEDIAAAVQTFDTMPDHTILGVRNFHDKSLNIPLRSRFGNNMTEWMVFLFTGVHISDTQTGLRCYPRDMAKRCLTIKKNRYEFQLEALLTAITEGSVHQIPIQTIYENNNACSHFNPVLDSIRIYLVFGKFILSSLICCLVDYILFSLAYLTTGMLLLSLLSSRFVSVLLNFYLNRTKVFADKGNIRIQSIKFLILAVCLILGSYWGMKITKELWGWSPFYSKILIEGGLFLISFFVQRLIIFSRKNMNR